MNDTMPKGRFKRTVSTGKIATRLGTSRLAYRLKKPFLAQDKKEQLRIDTEKNDARILFNGLALLRGTALKAAQMMSLETDLLPEHFRKELEKSYHQVPPINRALVRKIITTNFDAPPEVVFKSFDTTAFAAASLGQVHRAQTKNGELLALKIQYPDIAKTISNDIFLLKNVLRPMARYDVIKTALEEIETVLLNETDYHLEAANISFFSDHLKLDQVKIPEVHGNHTTRRILAMSFMDGVHLNEWLDTHPDQESKNKVAQILHDIFIRGFYELGKIHADPNPGNFLVGDDLKIGLIDFGCVREFDPEFIQLYKKMIHIGSDKNPETINHLLDQMQLVRKETKPGIKSGIIQLFMEMGNWINQMFKEDTFDFGANPDFMEQGKQIGRKMHQFRRHINRITPEFIFLDRTRYGLMQTFERMKANIRIKNRHESI